MLFIVWQLPAGYTHINVRGKRTGRIVNKVTTAIDYQCVCNRRE